MRAFARSSRVSARPERHPGLRVAPSRDTLVECLAKLSPRERAALLQRAEVFGEEVTVQLVPAPDASDATSGSALEAALGALEDLFFFETAVEAVSFGLVTAMRAIPSLAGLALLRDAEYGGYVVVYGRGPRSHEVVRARVSDRDPVVTAAFALGGPTDLEFGGRTRPPARHTCFGEPWTVMATPVRDGRDCLGLLELVDPLDRPADAWVALKAIADRLGRFLRGTRIVTASAFAPEQVGLGE
jgi:hypothetical protein